MNTPPTPEGNHGLYMSHKELDRLSVFTALQEGRITQKTAAAKLKISTRQVRRIELRFKTDGAKGLTHRLRGAVGNNTLPEKLITKVVKLVKEKYHDFGPTLAHEKLTELHKISLSDESVRKIMIKNNLWTSKAERAVVHRTCRERRSRYGELIQYDGSDHDWFEGRLPKMTLLSGIDDATGKLMHLRFDTDEGIAATGRYWKEYFETHGKPATLYVDRFSTYKVNHADHVDDTTATTQFEDALSVLGIEIIHAQTPQAKGRIERSHQTLQDRLPKEMRLAVITTVAEANVWLVKTFISDFNKRFAVVAREEGDAHRPLLDEEKKLLLRTLAAKTERRVGNDFTIKHKGMWYQIERTEGAVVKSQDRVSVEEWMDGTLHVAKREHLLTFKQLPKKPERAHTQKSTVPRVWKIPSVTHPWRQGYKPSTELVKIN